MEQPPFIKVEHTTGTEDFYTEMTTSQQFKSNMISNRDIIGLLDQQKDLEVEQKFIIDQATNGATILETTLYDLDEPPQHRRESTVHDIPQKIDLMSNIMSI